MKIKDYIIKRKAISPEFANYLYNYLVLKNNCLDTYLKYQRISPYNDMHGFKGDAQSSSNTFCVYGDTALDTLLASLVPLMNEETGLQLIPTYSYARLYVTCDVLKKHKDRKSCEYSTTLHLGGDEWPIFIENKNKKSVKVDLKPGDMLIYRGCDLEHWREEFTKTICGQVFLHYNLSADQDNLYDRRLHLGLPSSFKK